MENADLIKSINDILPPATYILILTMHRSGINTLPKLYGITQDMKDIDIMRALNSFKDIEVRTSLHNLDINDKLFNPEIQNKIKKIVIFSFFNEDNTNKYLNKIISNLKITTELSIKGV